MQGFIEMCEENINSISMENGRKSMRNKNSDLIGVHGNVSDSLGDFLFRQRIK